jgi:hypothetical protein
VSQTLSRSTLPLYRGEPASLAPALFVFSQLRELSGINEHTLKRWIEARVLWPTLKTVSVGTGGLRQFPAEEVVVATALVPFTAVTVTLERLGLLAQVFRNALHDRLIGRPESDIEQLHRDVRRALLRAVRGDGQNLVAVAVTETVHIWAFTNKPFDFAAFCSRTGAPATAPVMVADLTARLVDIVD